MELLNDWWSSFYGDYKYLPKCVPVYKKRKLNYQPFIERLSDQCLNASPRKCNRVIGMLLNTHSIKTTS
jgi:hypothetical protein